MKISKIKISDRYLKNKWYIKSLVIILIIVFIITIGALIKFYFDVNKESSGSSVLDNNIIADFGTLDSNYVFYRNKEGFAGVKDANDRYIIEPCWNNIFFLSDGRFVVQKEKNNELTMAVIDSNENYITPFVFKEVVSIGTDFLAAYFNSEDGFALLDTSGNYLSDKVWTGYEYSDTNKTVSLTDNTGKYSYRYENNFLVCTEISLEQKVENFDISYYSDDNTFIQNITSDRINSVFHSACLYFSSMLSGNTEIISDITNKQFLSSLSGNNLFNNCTVEAINNLKIDYSGNQSDGYIVSAEIIYDYIEEDLHIENLKSLVSLTFIDDENHVIILKSINKEEL
ncbi:MAG: hypothetical protein E7508_07570 [Ruminococcus sp.]|nr:hypothetical protein [Ruminococcus sp.]